MSILVINQASPEFQARLDWQEEATFRPGQFHGMEQRRRYVREAVRIEFENSMDEGCLYLASQRRGNSGSGSACRLAH